jgi:hypothetical protein
MECEPAEGCRESHHQVKRSVNLPANRLTLIGSVAILVGKFQVSAFSFWS